MSRMYLIYVFVSSMFLVGCAEEKSIKAAVVSARKEASEIGVEIMKKGGSAFDAMIATDLALAVCYPNAGNISGGGFLVYRTADGRTGSLDYREKAPIAASRDMYLDKNGNIIPEKSTSGGLAIGVPGTVAGLEAVHKKFGTLQWKELVQPAINLALSGYVVTEKQEQSFTEKKQDFIKVNGQNTFYAQTFRANDTVKNIALANTLKLIAKHGKSGFYEGAVAKDLIDRVQQKGGIMTHEDLISYEPVWRDPINFQYKDLNIYSMGPPSSGGICLGQIMKMIEPFNVGDYEHNSIETIQIIVEAERRSYADRSLYLGDPDFVKIPKNELLDQKYLSDRMKDFSFESASKSVDILPGKVLWEESEETTHYSIIDPMGNAIAVTTTLNGSYGSKVFVDEIGVFMNNEMDDFSSKPGSPNMFGLIGGKANSIQPRKRMLSSMTPTIVEKDGNLFLILGTPGGSTIITSVFQTILNAYEYKMGIQESIDSPRFHHQWVPDSIRFEQNFENINELKKLKLLGHKFDLQKSGLIGRVDAIMVDENGSISVGADKRGDDFAETY